MRYVVSMLMWVVVARWCYAEIALGAPWAIPAIDSALEVIQIPTHDTWSQLDIVQVIQDKELLQAKLDKVAQNSPLLFENERLATEELENLIKGLK